MEQLKTLKNAVLRKKKNASKVAAASPKSGDFAIFVQPKNGMSWKRYTPDRPLESEFMARLLCGSLVHSKRFAVVKVARWNAVRKDWGFLLVQTK